MREEEIMESLRIVRPICCDNGVLSWTAVMATHEMTYGTRLLYTPRGVLYNGGIGQRSLRSELRKIGKGVLIAAAVLEHRLLSFW